MFLMFDFVGLDLFEYHKINIISFFFFREKKEEDRYEENNKESILGILIFFYRIHVLKWM